MTVKRKFGSIGEERAKHVPLRVLCHGRPTLKIAVRYGWLPGARYTNLRDIRGFDAVGLIDIAWWDYDYRRHLDAVRQVRPVLTIAQDVQHRRDLARILDQAWELSQWAKYVVIVPKDLSLKYGLRDLVPRRFILGYSVPTRYGSTRIPLTAFGRRRVHLLGGRPDVQRRLGDVLNVFSLDGNRFTLDAAYGDFFDGQGFRPHKRGGFYECIRSSLRSINRVWHERA